MRNHKSLYLTMADALLDDLDDLSDVEPEEETNNHAAEETVAGNDGGIISAEHQDHNTANGNNETATDATNNNSRLLNNDALKSHLQSIRTIQHKDNNTKMSSNPHHKNSKEEDEHEHQLILTSNKHLASLRSELHNTHLDICKSYHPKFPELEELITDPFQYRAAIGIIQNELDVTNVNEQLNDVLSSNQIITISVAGSTTNGRMLTQEELNQVNNACLYLDELQSVQNELTSFVESRMEQWSPSVCALVGPAMAAQLLASTGGLAELARVPSCNLQLLGKNRSTASSRGGMATQSRTQHAGFLIDCDLVQACPNYLKMRAVKAVAGKLALAVRCDHINVESGRQRTADVGRKFKEELRTKFGKWEEPDKAQVVKALPKPDLTTKKRRGGKRIRRLKERFEETELMKQANKRAFSVEAGEYGDDAMGITLGMLDTKEGGAMRNTTEKRKMRQANTKASRKRAAQMSAGVADGLASSVVFTPTQGMELVNPEANKERVRKANEKWFSDKSGFQSALPRK
ncbi:U4/U6 small nuclear ribonucleoprotein Prp31 [Skeletonema marinoi]|uniref:U4/U6 small nuclear ribonucleoprotein Prp31 n=1 Tax=Skeletonema marinoi TaxID=267567 RepID=A0AAD8YB84_9STRA|nr:U4/U6 small nuclear ribonucleoprotein Prp31 [Skeletonema marinoi]